MIDTNHVENHANRLSRAYLAVHEATEAVFAAADQRREAAEALEAAKAKILNDYAIDPKALGSNEEARKAKLHEMTTPQRADLAICETAERKARHALDLANIELAAAKSHAGILDTLARAGAIVLATAPVLTDWAAQPPPPPPAAPQELPSAEQKEASGTPAKRRGRPPGSKNKDKDGEVATGEEAQQQPGAGIPWSAVIGEAEPDAQEETTPPSDALPFVEVTSQQDMGLDIPPPEAPVVDEATVGWSDPAPVEKPAVVTAEQVEVLRGLFDAAGMHQVQQHDFLFNEYPGKPTTLMTLPAEHYEPLRIILNGKVRAKKEAEAKAAEAASPEAIYQARGYDGAGQPITDDPTVTPEEAEEVRMKCRALGIAPAVAQAMFKRLYGAESSAHLRRSQARRLIDGQLAEEAEAMAAGTAAPW